MGRIKPERKNNLWIFKGTFGNDPTIGELIQQRRTPWQKIWAWIIFKTIPAYALHNKAWQIYVIPDSKRKKKLQEILLRRVAKRNILVRLVLGDDTVTQEEVDNVPHMTGFPWGVYLDETCRRIIRKMTPTEAEFNTFEYDLIVWLYENRKAHKQPNVRMGYAAAIY
ncbi:unnamed protein product [marine sediment metagenome]|uniref:Uncharacterized protein n=1 Tax=marine sediment metagenome TaxID=412755 RepID=X1RXJ4_9ZZZZ